MKYWGLSVFSKTVWTPKNIASVFSFSLAAAMHVESGARSSLVGCWLLRAGSVRTYAVREKRKFPQLSVVIYRPMQNP